MTTPIDLDALRLDERRAVLREVVAALSPEASWIADDRFEHYPLDVQAIAQLNTERCTEQLRTKEAALNKRLKSQYEREAKALTQKCLKDKQALKIEAEADRKAMGLEVARVKKRLIEAEREKHQATNQTAQSQRDARNLKQQLKETELQKQEIAALAKLKSDQLHEMEQQRTKERLSSEAEMQKLKEQILNLEAKLNNQEALWTDKCTDMMKSAEEEKAKTVVDLRTTVREVYQRHVSETLDQFLGKIQSVETHQRASAESVLGLREQLKQGYSMLSQIQSLFKDGAYEDVEIMAQTLQSLRSDFHAHSLTLQKLREQKSEIQSFLKDYGADSLHDVTAQIQQLRTELEGAQAERLHQSEELSAIQEKWTASSEELEELRIQNENLQHQASELQSQLQNTTSELQHSQRERDEWHSKWDAEQQRTLDLTEQLSVMTQAQTHSAEVEEELSKEKEQLILELESLKCRHQEELDTLQCSMRHDLLSALHQLKERCLGVSKEAMEQLKLSMMDATTHSCIRSLKVASALRGTGVHRKRLNSAIQSILTRVQPHLDSLISTSHLENLLEQLKTTPDVTDSSPESQAVKEAMLEIECCVFWLMLDGRIMRERTAELNTSQQKQSQRHGCNGSWLDRRSKGQSSASAQLPSKEDSVYKSEAEEIAEIIAVLKEYLQNGHQELPLVHPVSQHTTPKLS